MNKAVSVVIPTYNYAQFVSEAIDSVLAQTFPNVEIIVVDDGSTDNTKEVLSGYGAKIKYIFQKNKGVSAARNFGVRNSTGDLIAFLDADDTWFPDKIEKQIECFSVDAEVGYVHCSLEEYDVYKNIIGKYLDGANGWLADDLLLLRPVIVGPGSTLLLKRGVFDATGGFDERPIMRASEDWEFSYRLAKISKGAFVPEVLVRYRNHGENRHLKFNNVEQAMLLAYKEIFSQANESTLKLRRQAYGNLYTMLAGCYFQVKDYPSFIKNTLKGLWYSPLNINQYLTYPKRLWKRQISSSG